MNTNQEASQKVAELRAAYATATVGSKEWRRIAEELDFWIGRRAYTDTME